MVATNEWRRWLVDGWRRWMASMVGVDGGLGSSTQRALTWKSLCVPSSEGDTHRGSLLFVGTVCRITIAFVPVSRSRFVTVCCESCSTVWPAACVSFSQFSFSFVMVVHIMTVILTAALCCF